MSSNLGSIACPGREGEDRPGQATTGFRSRTELLAEYAGTTKADVAFALHLATSPGEVDAAAHLSLALFGVAGCNAEFEERGHRWPSLHEQLRFARGRVDGFPPAFRAAAERHAARSADATARRRSEAKTARRDRDERIRRLGFTNAVGGD